MFAFIGYAVMVVLLPPTLTGATSIENVMPPTKQEVMRGICDGQSNGAQLSDPFDCGAFIVCDNLEAKPFQCPTGLYFDNRLATCNWPEFVACGGSPSVNVENNDPHHVTCIDHEGLYFIPHTTECEKYYICANGITYMHHCGPGIHWDMVRNQCDRPQNAVCYNKQDVSLPPTTTITAIDENEHEEHGEHGEHEEPIIDTTTEISQNEIITDDILPECDGTQKFFPFPKDCAKYFICIGGAPFLMSCPTQFFWSNARLQCDTRESADCLI